MSASIAPSPATTAAWGAFAATGWRKSLLGLVHSLPAGSAWRRLALWLRKPLKSALPDPVDIQVWGLRLRLRSQGNLSEQRLILMPQFLDRLERETLARELAGGGVFFDIGANAGVYTFAVAAACGPAVRVESFEPDPELCTRLRYNLALNQLAQVHLNQLALGRAEGTATLVAGAGNKGENRVETETGGAKPSGTTVAITTLPAFLLRENITKIDALKIDVEGFEVDVLEPFFAACPRTVWPRLLICEVTQDPAAKLSALLSAHGYVLSARGRLNGIYRLAA
jgi:FkbM family methyltransferase